MADKPGNISFTNGNETTTFAPGGERTGQVSYHPVPAPTVAFGSGTSQNNDTSKQTPQQGSYHPYGEYYDDGYRKPAGGGLSTGGGYSYMGGVITNGTPQEEVPAEPVDTSYTKNDLLNTEANAQATKDMLKAAGYDLDNPPRQLDVPGQVALPNRIDLPNVALPNRIANPNVALPEDIALPNVGLPQEIALPDEVDYGNALDFEKAMQQAGVNIGRVDNVNIDQERAMLDQLTEAQRQQAILQADRAVETGTTQLQRQMQDAQKQFEAQQNQIAIDEQRALDNQALYAEARGDRGGIGQAQYNSIQNTAATNRLSVQQEQTQLATDTARQIADLRSQGEFEKANQLLSISQNYLGQLMDLYTWAKEANIGIDQFNLQVAQWEENYKLSLVDAQLDVQNSNLNLAQAKVAQAQQQFQNQFNQNQFLYNAAYQQAQQNFENAFNQQQTNYQNRWNQAQQLWQNEYQQENSLYNAAWNQATDLFNAAYNQENSQFEARRNVANDYFNNQLNAANYDINASKAALEAQLNTANATGAFANGTSTWAAQQQTREILAASGQALLEKGIIPTAEQLWAMGMTAEQAAQITGGGAAGGLAGGGNSYMSDSTAASRQAIVSGVPRNAALGARWRHPW